MNNFREKAPGGLVEYVKGVLHTLTLTEELLNGYGQRSVTSRLGVRIKYLTGLKDLKGFMSNTSKTIVPLWSLSFFLLCLACAPIKSARVAAVALTAEDVAKAAAKQSDPNVVRSGSPAYLMLIDGLLEAYPDSKDLLTAGCQAYLSYASSFLEDSDLEKVKPLYTKAKAYGFRALADKVDFQKAVAGNLEEFIVLLQQYKKNDVPALFCTASSWVNWINLNSDSLEALVEIPMLEATMRRILELDDEFHYGGPHLLLGAYLAAKPSIIGGDIHEAKRHFDRALALGEGKVLMAKVLFAKYYARRVGDRTLFEETLQEVLATPTDTVPELTLSNVLAQEKARKMLEQADDYFGGLP